MKPLSILLADDERDIRFLLVSWLERAGHHVTCAKDGVEAAAISEAKVFDLVISDIIMPESDGVQLITKLKKTRPTSRVLAMSGGGRVLAGTDCVRMAQGLGAHAAVLKPFTREQFFAAIDLAMDTKPAPTAPGTPAAPTK